MRVLVTGGAGYAGARIVPYLLGLDHTVTVLDNLYMGGVLTLDYNNYSFIHGDVRTAELEKFDAVLHLAAMVGKVCQADIDGARETNIQGTARMASMAADWGAKFIMFSTGAVYGNTDGVAVDEDAPLNPESIYAETKADAEVLVLALGGTVLRLNHLCGYSPTLRHPGLINECAFETARGKGFNIYGGDDAYAATHLRDVARVVAHLLHCDDIDGKLWNVASVNIRKDDIGKMARSRYPKAKIVVSDGNTASSYAVSTKRIEVDIGFKPGNSIDRAFSEIEEIVKAHA